MGLPRFYINTEQADLKHDMWLRDELIIPLWKNQLQYKPGQQVVLFDGVRYERLYEITELSGEEAHLKYITDFKRTLPDKEVYLLWALLEDDKNELIIKKCSEIGVKHFIPIISERSKRVNFSVERSRKIAVKAVEQCGRGDIPAIREPISVQTAIEELIPSVVLFVCDQTEDQKTQELTGKDSFGILVAPESGWSEGEKLLFKRYKIERLAVGKSVGAEEAAIVASKFALA